METEITTLAVSAYEPGPDLLYTIDEAAKLAQLPRRRILLYYKRGLISPIADSVSGGYAFDAEGIRKLRYIEQLRSICGDDLFGIAIILKLANEVESLRSELRRLSR